MDDSPRSRILKCLASASVGMVIGVVIAEVIANSLIEISLTYVFAIVRKVLLLNSLGKIFGITFLLLGVALSWRIWKSVQETSKRIFLLAFALLVCND